MKATGIVRRIDELGRVVIPKELRKTLGIKEGDPMEIFADDKNIMLKKYQPGCQCCGSLEDVKEIKGLKLCNGCVDEIKGAC